MAIGESQASLRQDVRPFFKARYFAGTTVQDLAKITCTIYYRSCCLHPRFRGLQEPSAREWCAVHPITSKHGNMCRHGVEGDPTVHKALPGMEQAQRAWRLAAYGRGQRLADAMRRKRILHPGREKEDARDVVDVEKIAGMQQPHYMRGMSDGWSYFPVEVPPSAADESHASRWTRPPSYFFPNEIPSPSCTPPAPTYRPGVIDRLAHVHLDGRRWRPLRLPR